MTITVSSGHQPPLSSDLATGIGVADASISIGFGSLDQMERAVVKQAGVVLPLMRDDGSARRGAVPVLDSDTLAKTKIVSTTGLKMVTSYNSDDTWRISGGNTLIATLNETNGDTEFQIRLGGRDRTDLGGQACKVSLMLGAHGMSALVRADATDNSGAILSSTVINIDESTPGGPSSSRHKLMRIAVPASLQGSKLSLRLEVRKAEDDPDFPPCLLLSNPGITLDSTVFAPPPIVVETERHATINARAEVDLSRSLDDMTLSNGTDSFAIKLPSAVGMEANPITDMTWRLKAERGDTYCLYIDGNFVAFAPVGLDWTEVSLPRRYFDGANHLVELRDRHGMRVLAAAGATLRNVLTPFEVLQREAGRPMPMQLANQAHFRYAALKKALERAFDANTQRQLAHAHAILGKGFDNLRNADFKPLAFPKVKKPDVSVVVPAHNKFELTYYCLCALLLAQNDATFEVVVVDDGSTDMTTTLPDLVEGITIVRNENAQRFLRACNAGVEASRGKYVVLLNNDTEPTIGWLDELIEPFLRFDDVGLTGSKLLYADGTLQEAGGIVWRSGNPWNYGRNANPMDPRYSYTREAHYLSGASMMTTRKIWDQVGGLSAYLEPMYFEDTDFAFKIRDAGFRTFYAPHSVVYHFEGKTSGTEVTSGMKAYQETNRPKFKARWAKAFNGFGQEGREVDLEKDCNIAGRVLFIDNSTPRPDNDAGSYAAVQEMKLVQSLGFKCTFLPRNLAFFGNYTDELTRQGIEVVTAPFYLSVNEYLEKHGSDFDVIYITRYYVAEDYIDAIRTLAPQAKIILMNADLHFLREIRTALLEDNPHRMEDARQTRERELAVMQRTDLTLSYNTVEHSIIHSHAMDRVKVAKCPWVVETRKDVPTFSDRKGIAFLGGYGHPPNAEAVLWFCENVMPLLDRVQPDLAFHIYGSAVPAAIAALESDTIKVPGFVDHVRDLHDAHRIFVAPLLTGAGIKGKVLGALAEGIPCVLSPVAAEGIGLRHGYDCFIAKTPQEWVDAIEKLNSDPKLWASIADNARAFVDETYSFEKGRDTMREAFHAVGVYQER